MLCGCCLQVRTVSNWQCPPVIRGCSSWGRSRRVPHTYDRTYGYTVDTPPPLGTSLSVSCVCVRPSPLLTIRLGQHRQDMRWWGLVTTPEAAG